jgi:hypothetical protein
LVGWCVFDLADPTATGIDQLEAAMVDSGLPRVECPIVHRFTPGLYIREISIPAGTLLTSMEHKLEHPFGLSRGRIKVSSDTEGSVIYEPPHTGITQPSPARAARYLRRLMWYGPPSTSPTSRRGSDRRGFTCTASQSFPGKQRPGTGSLASESTNK